MGSRYTRFLNITFKAPTDALQLCVLINGVKFVVSASATQCISPNYELEISF